GQGAVPTQAFMHSVSGDRESRARDVLLAEVRQRLLKLFPPLIVGPGDALAGWAGLPYAQKPEPVKAHSRKPVQFGIRNVFHARSAAELTRKLREPDSSVDLIERGIEGRGMQVFKHSDLARL